MTSQPEPPSLPPSFNVWNYKPWWCQPWSIMLTGLTVIGGSWLGLRTIWVTSLVSVPIGIWMGFFLVIYPRAMTRIMTEETQGLQKTPSRSEEGQQSGE